MDDPKNRPRAAEPEENCEIIGPDADCQGWKLCEDRQGHSHGDNLGTPDQPEARDALRAARKDPDAPCTPAEHEPITQDLTTLDDDTLIMFYDSTAPDDPDLDRIANEMEARGLDYPLRNDGMGGHGDGVSERPSGRQATGESGGGDYPRVGNDPPPENEFGSFMGHGGQSDNRYYGPGHERERESKPQNGRNADLQGQGSPAKDNAAPPEDGWRGERTDDPDENPELHREIRARDGHIIDVQETSGVSFAETERITKQSDELR